MHAYDGDAQVAHSHNFSLLDTNYFGPGYETDVFDWDVDDHPDPAPNEPVQLQPRGRYQLAPGTVMYYRAFEDAHIQYEPTAYSASINLLVHPPKRICAISITSTCSGSAS